MNSMSVEKWLLEGDGTQNNPPLNEEQRAAVTCEVNAVTAAGAGSGKTFVLARRYAYLVCVKHYAVSEILTLTFTRKATAEMYQRIYKTLLTVAQLFGDPYAKKAVEEFHTSRIQTLDSYCSNIAKLAVNSYGVTPDFTLDDGGAYDLASSMALPFILEHRNSVALQLMAKKRNLESLATELFCNIITKYSTLVSPIAFSQDVERQYKKCIEEYEKAVCDFCNGAFDLQEIYEQNKNSGKAFFNALGPALETFKKADSSNPIDFCVKSCSLATVSLRGQRPSMPWHSIVTELRELFASLVALANFIERKPLLEELALLLEKFQSDYVKQKRVTGILTFRDVACLAQDILKNNIQIRQSEKESYKAVMIDEFQDDNKLQKDILYAICERKDICLPGDVPADHLEQGKLFFVGDEKQSIYRFRGADVSVFRKLSQELGTGTSASLWLSRNYRSHPDLIAAFNCIFGGYNYNQESVYKEDEPSSLQGETSAPSEAYNQGESIFPLEGSPTEEYQATYTKVYAGKRETRDPGTQREKRVHVCLYSKDFRSDEEDALSHDENEAFFVAKKIKELTESGKAKPEEIAILFRTLTKQSLYERYLKQMGIPYVTESVVGFFSDAPVNDILHFLTLLVYPKNQTAYCSVLRSPFVALSSESLERLLAHGSEEIFDPADSELLDGDQRELYEKGCTMYREIAEHAGTMALTELLTKLWYKLGYRYETMWHSKFFQYGELYDQLFALAAEAQQEGAGLTNFVESLRSQAEESQRLDDMDIPLEGGKGVRIMTIHKSKGLEFPVVFLSYCSGEGFKNQNPDIAYYSEKDGMTFNIPSHPLLSSGSSKTNFFYDQAAQEAEKQQEAELRRLLYVAMTRAEKELYVTGILQKPSGNSTTEKSFIKLLYGLLNKYIPNLDQISQEDVVLQVTEDSPFDVEVIPAETRRSVYSEYQRHGRKSEEENRKKIIQQLEPFYQKTPITMVQEESHYRNPSGLFSEWQRTTGNLFQWEHYNKELALPVDFPKGHDAMQDEIDEIVLSTLQKDDTLLFGYGELGTCVHLYLEAVLKGEQPVIPSRFLQLLSAKNQEKLKKVCSKLAQRFFESSTGKDVQKASWYKSEFPFKYKIDKYVLKGTMDLIYKTGENTYHIVDFKTDKKEEPFLYFPQQSAYRAAAAVLLHVPEPAIRCFLYYLRSGHLIDITQECDAVDLKAVLLKAALSN